MIWETVKIENSKKGRTMPYASVGFGRISLNAAACELLGNYEQFSFVELLKGRNAGKLCIGLRFLKKEERTSNSIPISRRKQKNGKYIVGMDIACKGTIENLFGINGTANKSSRYEVKIDDTFSNILMIIGE